MIWARNTKKHFSFSEKSILLLPIFQENRKWHSRYFEKIGSRIYVIYLWFNDITNYLMKWKIIGDNIRFVHFITKTFKTYKTYLFPPPNLATARFKPAFRLFFFTVFMLNLKVHVAPNTTVGTHRVRPQTKNKKKGRNRCVPTNQNRRCGKPHLPKNECLSCYFMRMALFHHHNLLWYIATDLHEIHSGR